MELSINDPSSDINSNYLNSNSYSYNEPTMSFLSLPSLSRSIGSKLFSSHHFSSNSNSISNNKSSFNQFLSYSHISKLSLSFSFDQPDSFDSFFSRSFMEPCESKITDIETSHFSSSSMGIPTIEHKTITVSMDILNETSETFSAFKQFILITSFSNLLNIDSKNIFIKSITDKYIANALRFLSISGITVELDFQVDPSLATAMSDDIMYIFQSGTLKNELASNGLSVDIALNELYIDQNPITINDDLIGGGDDLFIDDDGLLIGSGDENGDGDSDDHYNSKIVGSVLGSFFLVFAILGVIFYRKRLHHIKISIPPPPFTPNEGIRVATAVADGPNLYPVLPYVKNENGVKMDLENRFVNVVA